MDASLKITKISILKWTKHFNPIIQNHYNQVMRLQISQRSTFNCPRKHQSPPKKHQSPSLQIIWLSWEMDHISYLAHFHSLFNGLIKMTSPAVISKLENSSLMHRLEGNSKWPVLTLRPTCKNRNKHSDTNQKWIATMSKLKQLPMICLHILKIPDMFSCCKKFMTCRRTLELYEHQWLGHVLVISSDQRHIFKYLFIITPF